MFNETLVTSYNIAMCTISTGASLFVGVLMAFSLIGFNSFVA